MPKQNADLLNETAAELLEAIKAAAPTAQNRNTEGLESLARAYALVAGRRHLLVGATHRLSAAALTTNHATHPSNEQDD